MIDLEGAARQSGVIPPEKISSLIAALKKVPDFSWLLSDPHPSEQRLQADLLNDFPVALIAPDGAVRSKRFAVLILNNTCDLQPNRSRFVSVAPVLDFEEFAKVEITKRGENGAQSYLHDIRSNRVFELLAASTVSYVQGGRACIPQSSQFSRDHNLRAVTCQQRASGFIFAKWFLLLLDQDHDASRSRRVTRGSEDESELV